MKTPKKLKLSKNHIWLLSLSKVYWFVNQYPIPGAKYETLPFLLKLNSFLFKNPPTLKLLSLGLSILNGKLSFNLIYLV